ncbi:aldo/keto reductase [Lapidilactobacillus bayanensis]|uniref:aldo/keto reductase n=1 Tax=Lapidilactobacillus bayanensis TaxID=2485998 RepID=UPI000F77F5D3|nr:aldo/keto reductase [Lapidilactobacillus bayanensis]
MNNRQLINGVEIPAIGYGTGMPSDEARTCVSEAIRTGYRLIDTAEMYHDETGVGQGIKDTKIPRNEIFISSKLNNPIRNYDETIAAFNQSLKDLQTDYLDLFLIHWPNPSDIRPNWEKRNAECWRALEDLYLQGKIRAIGVSNFWVHHLKALEKTQRVAPMVNQLLLAPGEKQEEVVAYCKQHNIQLEGYSPLGKGKIMNVDLLKQIADTNGKTPAQIALAWSMVHEFIPLPRSTKATRMKENYETLDVRLSAQQIDQIDQLDGVLGKSANPDLI